MQTTPSETPPPAVAQTSLAARLVNIFAVPGDVFNELKGRAVSTANWLAPVVIFIAASWLASWLIFSQDSVRQQLAEIQDRAIQKQVEKGKLTQAQADQARVAAEKFGHVGRIFGGVVGPVVGGFALPFWWGLWLWLGGRVVFKAALSYMKAVEVAGLAVMISALEAVVKGLLIVLQGNLFAGPHLALLVKDFDQANPAHLVLAALDVMVFWALAVKALGLARLSGISFGKAAGWVFGVWAVFKAGAIGVGLLAGRAFGS